MNTKLIAGVATFITAATGVGVASGAMLAHHQTDAAGGQIHQRPPVTAVDTTLKSDFRVFRVTQARASSGSSSDARTQAKASPLIKEAGGNVVLAREVGLPGSSESVLVIPAEQGVCLWVPISDGYGGGCSTVADAARGKLSLQVLADDTSRLVALVPDGVPAPALEADGKTVALPTRGNIAAGRARNAEALTVGETTTALTAR